jgi:hypothetical protein
VLSCSISGVSGLLMDFLYPRFLYVAICQILKNKSTLFWIIWKVPYAMRIKEKCLANFGLNAP